LAHSDACLVAGEFLLEPDFRKPRGRIAFDGRNGVDAADIVAPDPAGVVDLEEVDEARKPLPTDELAEIDGQNAMKLALVDCADPGAAMHIGQEVVGILQAIDHTLFTQPLANAGRIAVVRQARGNRNVRDAVLGAVPPLLGQRPLPALRCEEQDRSETGSQQQAHHRTRTRSQPNGCAQDSHAYYLLSAYSSQRFCDTVRTRFDASLKCRKSHRESWAGIRDCEIA
jgi:hypothetical protein